MFFFLVIFSKPKILSFLEKKDAALFEDSGQQADFGGSDTEACDEDGAVSGSTGSGTAASGTTPSRCSRRRRAAAAASQLAYSKEESSWGMEKWVRKGTEEGFNKREGSPTHILVCGFARL